MTSLLVDQCIQAGDRVTVPARSITLREGGVSVRALKHVVHEAHHLDLAAAMEVELSAYNRLFKTADRREGVASFNEKRTPKFEGR